jgi:hypothetical protein
MSAATTKQTITIYQSTIGDFAIVAHYSEEAFVSARASHNSIPVLTFKDHLDLTNFLQCIREFESELKK